jgi:muramoyltetrapeptide carboxypeptidase LdcA involved in peptidoglycan recycling
MIIPSKIKRGAIIRVIAPSASLAIPQKWLTKKLKKKAYDTLTKLGLKVTFGKHINEVDDFLSSSIETRLVDLHDAFEDKKVKMVLCAIGGFNANQLLKYIDYDLIRLNHKIFCGYSDITVLSNAIFAKTGLVTYSGPHFTSFGSSHEIDYTLSFFRKCLFENKPYSITSSEKWFDYSQTVKNEGYWVINEGSTNGTIIGGNLCTFNELHGTEFMPSLKGSILFLEDDSLVNSRIFDRDLQSLIHQKGFKEVRGIVVGRFQTESHVTKELLSKIIKGKKELCNIPVIGNVDFGHTKPLITFPIGGKAQIKARGKDIEIEILEH